MTEEKALQNIKTYREKYLNCNQLDCKDWYLAKAVALWQFMERDLTHFYNFWSQL